MTKTILVIRSSRRHAGRRLDDAQAERWRIAPRWTGDCGRQAQPDGCPRALRTLGSIGPQATPPKERIKLKGAALRGIVGLQNSGGRAADCESGVRIASYGGIGKLPRRDSNPRPLA